MVLVQYFPTDNSVDKYASKIKYSISKAQAAFNRQQTFVTSKLDLNLRRKLVKC